MKNVLVYFFSSLLIVLLIICLFANNRINVGSFQKKFKRTPIKFHHNNMLVFFTGYYYVLLLLMLLFVLFLSTFKINFDILHNNVLTFISLITMWLAFIFTFSSVITSIKKDIFIISMDDIVASKYVKEKLFALLSFFVSQLFIIIIYAFLKKDAQTLNKNINLIILLNHFFLLYLVNLYLLDVMYYTVC